MIRRAIEYVVELSAAKELEINGRKYTDKKIIPVNEPKIIGFETGTLTSIIDYLKDNPDNQDYKHIIAIENVSKVSLQSAVYGDFNQRNSLIEAKPFLPDIEFGRFMSSERFIIELQSKFARFEKANDDGEIISSRGDAEILQKIVGNIKGETVRNFGDDGVSQKVEIKQGITTVAEAVVPNPVILAPFRTFPEIIQVESEFIFRMREGNAGVEMALFEADGGAWRMKTIERIKAWLEKEIKENNLKNITILA